MEKIRAAIIGTGGISALHTEGYRKLPDVEVAALCDIDLDKALAYAEQYGVDRSHVYADFNEMLANPVKAVTSEGEKLGISEGMTGEQVCEKLA